MKRNPSDLSVGQRSRVGSLRAVSSYPTPDVIFADEPTANVDYKSEGEILDLLSNWCASDSSRGRTVLLSTHRLDLASRYCDSFIIINRDIEGQSSEAVALSGRQNERTLCDLIFDEEIIEINSVGSSRSNCDIAENSSLNRPNQDISSELSVVPHSMLMTYWKLLFRDFWRHHRSDGNFLAARMTPLLFLLSIFVLVCVNSYIVGIRSGSDIRYQSEMQNVLLWNTEISASSRQMEELLSGDANVGLLKSYSGFFRFPVLAFINGTTDFHDLGTLEQLAGRSMENEDPLLDRIGETLMWPEDENEKREAITSFRNRQFGVIISADVLVETLGYERGSPWPDAIPLRYDESTQIWVPILGISEEIPVGDFILNTSIYDAYMSVGFVSRFFNADRFYLGLEEVSDESEALSTLKDWLNGLGIAYDSIAIRNIRGTRVVRVNLVEREPESDLQSKMRTRWDTVVGVIEDVQFPKVFDEKSLDGQYYRWSVILNQSTEAIRKLIAACYKQRIYIDTSVKARVKSLEESYSIFRFLSDVLFWTTLALASFLLFTISWFDSNRKIHSVGVLLGLGVSRKRLICAYAAQLYLLIGSLLIGYFLLDLTGYLFWATGKLTQFLGKADLIVYSGWTRSWLEYTGTVLVGIPILLAVLRYILYRNHPASLISFRD